ncbi:hypothetical protein DQQ10_27490 [Pseudochryseolinea flava]|uniref:Uncharacterized protein n=1 Tax=Pseudochryseolinea flava TaxID=2059302 RepID=A0A364XTE4_9BACT|nr:hypothetical protein DQQ10_27490 [Pseudochryseolinea flava]
MIVQAQNVPLMITKYFDDVRSDLSETIPATLLLKSNEQIVFNHSQTFLQDSAPTVRKVAISLIAVLGTRDGAPSVQGHFHCS